MTVEYLIEELKRMPPDATVVVIESGQRRAVPHDVVELDYVAGQVRIGVEV